MRPPAFLPFFGVAPTFSGRVAATAWRIDWWSLQTVQYLDTLMDFR